MLFTHNIMRVTNWIVIRAQFYRLLCEKVTQKTETDDRNTVKIVGAKRPVSVLCVSFVTQFWKVCIILLWIRIKFLFQWYRSSLAKNFLCVTCRFANQNTDIHRVYGGLCQKQKLNESIGLLNKLHNALVPYPTMHQFATEMCIFLLQNGALWFIFADALWNLWDWGINFSF